MQMFRIYKWKDSNFKQKNMNHKNYRHPGILWMQHWSSFVIVIAHMSLPSQQKAQDYKYKWEMGKCFWKLLPQNYSNFWMTYCS